jgi:Spy/CpxP family protein refolding chaperone
MLTLPLSILLVASEAVGAEPQSQPAQVGTNAPAPVASADGLTEQQKAAIVAIRDETQREAAPVAAALASTVKESFEKMLSEEPDPAAQNRLCKQAADSLAQLITIANRGMQKGVAVLTPEQKQKVRSEMGKPGAPGDLLELIARVYGIPQR